MKRQVPHQGEASRRYTTLPEQARASFSNHLTNRQRYRPALRHRIQLLRVDLGFFDGRHPLALCLITKELELMQA